MARNSSFSAGIQASGVPTNPEMTRTTDSLREMAARKHGIDLAAHDDEANRIPAAPDVRKALAGKHIKPEEADLYNQQRAEHAVNDFKIEQEVDRLSRPVTTRDTSAPEEDKFATDTASGSLYRSGSYKPAYANDKLFDESGRALEEGGEVSTTDTSTSNAELDSEGNPVLDESGDIVSRANPKKQKVRRSIGAVRQPGTSETYAPGDTVRARTDTMFDKVSLAEADKSAKEAGARGLPPVTFVDESAAKTLLDRRTKRALNKAKSNPEKDAAESAAAADAKNAPLQGADELLDETVEREDATNPMQNPSEGNAQANARQSVDVSPNVGGRTSDFGRRGRNSATATDPRSHEELKQAIADHKKNVMSGNDNPHEAGTEAYAAYMSNAASELKNLEKLANNARQRAYQSGEGTKAEIRANARIAEIDASNVSPHEKLSQHRDDIAAAHASGDKGAVASYKAAYFIKKDILQSHPQEVEAQLLGISRLQQDPDPCQGDPSCGNMIPQDSGDEVCADCANSPKNNAPLKAYRVDPSTPPVGTDVNRPRSLSRSRIGKANSTPAPSQQTTVEYLQS